MDFSKNLTATELDFFTDVSGAIEKGFGAVFGNHWTYGKWEPGFIQLCKPSIEYLELYALTVAIELWSESAQIRNRRVVIFCDNQSVVDMINHSTSSCHNCMVLIRHITLISLRLNIRYFVHHVCTSENILADALSRGQLERFWRNTLETMDSIPFKLPDNLYPPGKIWSHQ